MKKHNIKTSLLVFFFSLFAWSALFLGGAAPARADESVTAHIKVAALDQILYDDDFTVQGCADTDNASSTELTLNAFCAINQLAANQGWTATSTWYSFGVMLNSINDYDGADGNYWLWFSESEPGETALNQHILSAGENLLLTYGTSPLKLTVSSSSPLINATTTISVFYFDINAWQWAAAESTFFVNGQKAPTSAATYELLTTTTTPYVVSAQKPGFIESAAVTILPQLPIINIKLRVEGETSTLYNQNLIVAACEGNTNSGVYSLNGRCALDQSGLAPVWSSWGSDLFLDSLAGATNNSGGNGIYWNWFKNLDYGTVALNNHILSENEELLLAYGRSPLRIIAATSTPYLNGTTTLTIKQFDFDANWNPTWQAAASSTLIVNGQEFFSADGTLPLFIATTSPYAIYASKTGYANSPTIVLAGILPPEATTTPVVNPANQPAGPENSGNNGSNSSSASSHQTINVSAAANFLAANQNPDGSIGSSILYSDWSAIALGALGESEAKNKLKNYLTASDYATDPNSKTADLERRAMALMALGVNPYKGTDTDYIARISSAFDGAQIGNPDLFNDDIFALFPLLGAGYSGTDAIIDKTLRFIISKQSADGSWNGVDLTAAAAQALALAQKTGGAANDLNNLISQALTGARSFLRAAQTSNGSFANNAISTAWAAQGILALGETISSWENNGKNPMDFLSATQAGDGGLEAATTAIATRIWTTAYAIPAALNKTWGDILFAFSKPAQSSASNSADSGTISSSGNIIATSTPDAVVATSSPLTNITNATSTPMADSSTPNVGGAGLEIKNQTDEAKHASAQTKSDGPTQLSLTGGKNIGSGTISVAATPSEQPVKPTPEKSSAIKNDSLNLQAQAAGPALSGAGPIISESSSAQKAAKIIFYSSSAVVISLGLYFVIKFILTLI